ncbi:RNA polymerase II Elongator subunit [Magnaporthiopsis poae ATCC 64411]|uniref:Elongator complex protein 2 n=1 Tax=Magnaporthiopsis poae (strain ATCC 64411 / 73-15) TaxID=644358 RepID=A0A0C4E5L4_MAGP6|nr:RNA polymerase II Elongator subunit [Magnaporthiopsis poae ATCC 64411]
MTMGPPSIDADAIYISAGANRHSAVADWSRDGTVAYGTDANIALWKPTDERHQGVTRLLRGHKDTVKAVKFIPAGTGGTSDEEPLRSYLVSGADDQCLILWELGPDDTLLHQTVHEHTASINCIAVLGPIAAARARTLVASGAADATIKIWTLEAGALRLLQTIQTKPKYFPLALALSPLDGEEESYILAAAGTKPFVQMFATTTKYATVTATDADAATASSTDSVEFKLQATLSGHEGWIRSLDFAWEDAPKAPQSDLLLASASQDKYIRLWRVHGSAADGSPPSKTADATSEAVAGSSSSALVFPGKSPSNKAHRFTAGTAEYSVSFEALLLGHDDWIYSAKWHSSPAAAADGGNSRPRLLSTSADNSLAIWEADVDSGIWITSARLGELSKEKGATTATGSIGGFWTGLWSPSGRTVVCLGRTGSWRRWDLEADDSGDHSGGMWRQALSVSGHTKAVTGITWSRDGGYLLSTSSDQTTRLHAEWRASDETKGDGGSEQPLPPTWHEMARPQIHGYDLNCIDSLGPSQFVSGADEKLMRVFSAPKAVARLLTRLTGNDVIASDSDDGGLDALPDAANIPVLGLSNKAVEADSLSRHTLWPEIEKLYGHGYELSCLAASHDGRVVASACRASSLNHAVIRLFATSPRWTEVRPPLAAHSLTATRLRFSPDDAFLLSVGRDRQWAVFQRGGEAPSPAGEVGGVAKPDADAELRYRLFQANPKGHTRMILDASWAPLLAVGDHGPLRAFATAGRDKNVKVWTLKDNKAEGDGGVESAAATATRTFELATTIPLEHAATAVDFLWRPLDGGLVLAVGTEAGKISTYILDPESWAVVTQHDLNSHLCSSKSMLQLAWRPAGREEAPRDQQRAELAVACEDSSLRIYKFRGL